MCLKVVESLHPEQIGKRVTGDVSEKEHRRKGVVKAPGAQHATTDEWIAMMEEVMNYT